ncbi:hypothetical protein LTR78_002720 [Recurvomyces mirabilis]|uniref:Uncharacterized protein n=1 Tax=Recurvomyces mirabilis TaxID=574656 RepID=A0AAE1C3X8_9PEZI|nr:hypothetical protein LTR78_002720 [Recurvomyces mirabilis]
MATTTNGTSTPPAALSAPQNINDAAPSDTSAHKRKREDEGNTTSARKRQTQRDILELLQQHDTTPSFLDHNLSHVTSGSERSPKKARLSDAGNQITIASKLSAGIYDSLSGLKLDANGVTQGIESALRAKTRDGEGKEGARLPVEDLKQIQRAKALEQLITDVVDKELQHGAMAGIKKEASSMVNGHVSPAPGAGGRAGTVLTLFGNAPTPKQLFSSMQNGTHQDHMVKTELPVEEMSLPNGLTATKIAPAPADDGRKGPTFEDSFAPPYSLATLNPPKVTKRSSTRDNATLYWEFKDAHRASRKGGYTVQAMTTGDWLGYGGLGTADSETSRQKRKQRDRALSSGAESAKEVPSLLSPEEQQAREEEALFRRAYSSFAPSHDNSRSLVPAETRSMLWWHEVGAQRYRETFAVDPALLDEGDAANGQAESSLVVAETEDADFGKVIDELEELDVDMADVQQVTSKSDVEHVLLEISELLETLASHQRIRNATLATSTSSSRTPISPAPVLASRIGKPDEPAEDELAVYHSLRRELAYLVLKLPPYAVAKLDGDQLSELGISTVIPIKTKNIRGTMEEDQVARLAKHNAAATAAGIATLTRSNSSTSGQHYNTTAQRTPAIGSAANTRYGQSAQYTSSRTPAPNTQYQRTTSSQAQYSTPTGAASTATRTYNGQPVQYSRPGAPRIYSQTNDTTRQQYYQHQQARPEQTSSGQYYGTQQPTRPAYNPTPSQPHYASRPPSATTSSNTALAAFHNSSSKPISKQQQQQLQQQGQGPTSGRATPTYPSGPQTPVNGFARPPPPQPQQGLVPRGQSATPGANGVV